MYVMEIKSMKLHGMSWPYVVTFPAEPSESSSSPLRPDRYWCQSIHQGKDGGSIRIICRSAKGLIWTTNCSTLIHSIPGESRPGLGPASLLSYSGDKAAGVWSWIFTPIYNRDCESLEIFSTPSLCLHGHLFQYISNILGRIQYKYFTVFRIL